MPQKAWMNMRDEIRKIIESGLRDNELREALKKYHENDIHKLHFTEAVRPKTMQVFPYCDNCKAIFPNL